MQQPTTTSESPPARTAETARQPTGLWTLAGLEMWERFSFYGIQVILAYYIYFTAADGGLGLPEAEAFAITGAYGGAVYLSQPIGAWLADRLVPARTLVMAGGVIIMVGHITLAFAPGLGGLLAGLALIVIGTGAMFPNVLAMMNLLYDEHSPRREFGFTLYYTGILVGALVGPIATGFLQAAYGFHVGFSAAAFGMCVGLIWFIAGRNTLPDEARVVPNPAGPRTAANAAFVGVVVIALIALLALMGVLTTSNLNNVVITVILIVAVVYFVVMHRSPKVEPLEKRRILAFIPLFIVTMVFWTLILQLFTTFAVYAETRVDLALGPVTIPAAYISTFQVVTGIIAGPLIASVGQRYLLRNPGRSVSPAVKLGLSYLLMAATFLLFAIFAMAFQPFVPLIAVIVGMVLLGVTEVTYAPIVFSATGQLAPRKFNAQMMALGGLALAAGASLSGFLGQLYVSIPETTYFLIMAAIAIVCSAVLFVCRSSWKKVGIV